MCNFDKDSLKNNIFNFYTGLAHEGDNEGLEGQLGILAGKANDCSPDILDSIQTFLEKTAGARKTFYSQEGVLGNLLNEVKRRNNKNLLLSKYVFIICIYDLHKTIKKHLNDLDKCFIKTLNGPIEHKEIAQFAICAGTKLNELLKRRKELKEE
jgi:hypothetical protein|tara:strand:+ start:1117 stop:1578 length:462 start_codon:yes stop_codon:yes gene_type:complete